MMQGTLWTQRDVGQRRDPLGGHGLLHPFVTRPDGHVPTRAAFSLTPFDPVPPNRFHRPTRRAEHGHVMPSST